MGRLRNILWWIGHGRNYQIKILIILLWSTRKYLRATILVARIFFLLRTVGYISKNWVKG